MNTNIKSKLFGITIILLLLVNTAVVTFMLLSRNKKMKPPLQPQQKGSAFLFLVNELKLDSNQVALYSALRDAHKTSADSINILKREAKDALFNLLKTNNVNDSNVQQQLSAISQIEKSLDEITFSHFKAVRTLCSVQQQTKFDEVIATALRMQAPRHHRPPPHDRRPPQEGEGSMEEHRP